MLPTNDSMILLMRCHESNLLHLLQLRSKLIQKILNVAKEFCSPVKTVEMFIDPSNCIHYPLKLLNSFDVGEIANAVIENTLHPAVVSPNYGNIVLLENLLLYEPYAGLGELLLNDLFDVESSNSRLSNDILLQFSEYVSQTRGVIFQHFKPDPKLFAKRIPKYSISGQEQELLLYLEIWRDECEGTYQSLREKLDQISIFALRNPLVCYHNQTIIHSYK